MNLLLSVLGYSKKPPYLFIHLLRTDVLSSALLSSCLNWMMGGNFFGANGTVVAIGVFLILVVELMGYWKNDLMVLL